MVVMHLTSEFEAPPYGETGLKRIKEITKYAKKLGIKVAFENTKIKGYLDYIITNIICDNVGICFDSGHYHAHFDDDFNFELYKDRIFAIHLHDNDKSYDQHLIPYDGTIDWEFLIRQLKECNYNGPITLELCYRDNYLNLNIKEFYKMGYEIAEKISNRFVEE